VRLIAGIPAKVNLIPFNPWPNSAYEPSTPKALNRFAQIVMDAGFASPIRTPRGRDILAACGQLRTESRRARAGSHAEPAGPTGLHSLAEGG
jgi:23S rRNA (adenine2503-C2)-methyltransferase